MKFPGTYRFPENPRIVEFPKSSNHPEIPRGKLTGLEIPKNFQKKFSQELGQSLAIS